MTAPSSRRIFVAEFVGTAVLCLVGLGSAVLPTSAGGDALHTALAFGLTLAALAYAVGPVSGCHLNPAVTLAAWAAKKVESGLLATYIGAQVLGGLVGGVLLYAIAKGQKGFSSSHNFAANGWGRFSPGHFDLWAIILTEIIFTAVLVFAYLAAAKRGMSRSTFGLTIGFAYVAIHLVTLSVDNTSVNPARSIAAAVFSGGDALKQLWAFIFFPILGGLVGLLAWLAVDESRLEDTRLDVGALEAVRDLVE
jgi:aquaporin Z